MYPLTGTPGSPHPTSSENQSIDHLIDQLINFIHQFGDENAHNATELLPHMVQHTASGIKIRLIRINNYNCLYHDIFLEI